MYPDTVATLVRQLYAMILKSYEALKLKIGPNFVREKVTFSQILSHDYLGVNSNFIHFLD